MAFTRIENQTPDGSIPYGSFPNKSIFIHGSTKTRNWRTRFLTEFGTYNILVLDPWKNAWSDYIDSFAQTIEDIANIEGMSQSPATPGTGGLVPGYVAPTLPDIQNIPFSWETRNVLACNFQYFEFDDGTEIPSHSLILLGSAIKKDPTKVVVNIPPADWRINIALFLKRLPRENYFGQEVNAFRRVKEIMGL